MSLNKRNVKEFVRMFESKSLKKSPIDRLSGALEEKDKNCVLNNNSIAINKRRSVKNSSMPRNGLLNLHAKN